MKPYLFLLARTSSRRLSVLALLLVSLLSLTITANPTPVKALPGFVTRQGTRFMLDGKPFYVAGTNNHYLGWGTQYEVDDVLTSARNMGLNVVRGIMHSVRGSLDSTAPDNGTVRLKWNWASTNDSSNMGMKGVYIMYWNTATGKMDWNNNTSNGLGRWDYVIWKAEQLGLKLNIALLDFWQWAGGAQQISANYNGGNYDTFHAPDRHRFFFQNAATKQMYKDWVWNVLNRTNTLTGRQYKNEPAIMAWDLMNEPEMEGTTLGQAWISEMAAHIKSIDPNHLLATGSEGFTDGHVGSNPQLEMNQPNIDFATWHTYPTYHQYGDNAINGGNSLITQHCATAASGGKPVILQEFAYPINRPDEQTQANIYNAWLNTIYSNNNCAGWMFWRLEGLQEGGYYAPDNTEGYNVINNNGPTANVLRQQAARLVAKNCSPCGTVTSVPPTSTRTPTRTNTRTNTPSLPTNTPSRATATRTNTPGGATATRTPTRTNTSSVPTNTAVSSSLKIQSRANEANANATSLQPFFKILNTGSASVPMSELKVRYYFTKDNTRPILWNCNWAQIGCQNVSGAIVAMTAPKANADTYLELSFTAAAGSIAASGNSGEIQNYIKHDDWSQFSQSNDFSFNSSNPYIDWTKITLYRNGTLVWGTEP